MQSLNYNIFYCEFPKWDVIIKHTYWIVTENLFKMKNRIISVIDDYSCLSVSSTLHDIQMSDSYGNKLQTMKNRHFVTKYAYKLSSKSFCKN